MIGAEDLKRLSGVPGPCLTLYQPLRDGAGQALRTGVELGAAISEADALLAQRGVNKTDRESFLRPVRKLAENTDWSAHAGTGIIFRAPEFTKAAFWPDLLKPALHLTDEFFILPLIARLRVPRSFWILGLSINEVKLFRGSLQELSEMQLPHTVPQSLEAAGGFDQPDHELGNRSYAGPSTGKMRGVRFGTSLLHEVQRLRLHDYFKMIDRGIRRVLARSSDPLILAGVSRETSIYAKVNTYPRLMKESVHGSPAALGKPRLLKAALDIVSRSAGSGNEPDHDFEAAADRRLVLTDRAAILRSAKAGKIQTLYIAPDVQEGKETINRCALAVIRNSGFVKSVSASRIPGGLAAVLRYRASAA